MTRIGALLVGRRFSGTGGRREGHYGKTREPVHPGDSARPRAARRGASEGTTTTKHDSRENKICFVNFVTFVVNVVPIAQVF